MKWMCQKSYVKEVSWIAHTIRPGWYLYFAARFILHIETLSHVSNHQILQIGFLNNSLKNVRKERHSEKVELASSFLISTSY